MSNGNHIIRAVRSKGADDAAEDTSEPLASDAEYSETDAFEDPVSDAHADEYTDADYEELMHPKGRLRWIIPAVALLVVAAWTALYAWAMRGELATAASVEPAQWTRWIIDWSVPVLLVGIVWLIAMRNSRAEAQRFADTAALLSNESAELERRLTVVNRELSLAREFLAAQSLDLESLGRVASEKLSTHAAELQELITTNGEQVDRIGSASETALGNMNKLRDDLPVVANSARDVSNQVGNAGRTAHEQLEKLIAGFERLNEFGSASEKQATSLNKRIGTTLTDFATQLGQLETIVTGRFDVLQTQAAAYRNEIGSAEETALSSLNERMELLQSETKAVAARLRDAEVSAMEQLHASKERFSDEVTKTLEALDMLDRQSIETAKARIAEVREEAERFDATLAQRDVRFIEEMERRQAQFETREAQATEILAQRLAELDEAIAERRENQTEETAKLVAHSMEMGGQLEQLRTLIGSIREEGDATRTSLTGGLDDLDSQLAQKREALAETESQLANLTEAGIRLLEILQSGAQQTREDLPNAIKAAASDLGQVEERASELNSVMFSTSQHGKDLSAYLVKTQASIAETDESIVELQARLAEQTEDTLAKLQGLRTGFAKLSDEGHSFAEETQAELRNALDTLENATRSAFVALDEGARDKVAALSESISTDAVEALERSLRSQSAETIGKLEQAAAHASGVGREATVQLRDQLAKVNELTGNLEQRVTRARELAEEQVNNDFSRRMSLITDSLNSNAIDISSALSQDVTDTAWDAYLKGDRGIFTRRAVRLIDNGEAREIADLYQQDDAFKANVTRYIHDFEKMLRSMLSTRDGNAMSVTILGSDMGKLYVVLAQAIERFRN